MSHGIQIFRADGVLTYDSSSITWNQVASFILPAGQGGSFDFPALAGLTAMFVISMLNAPPTTSRAIVPTGYFSGTTLVLNAGTVDTYVMVLAQ